MDILKLEEFKRNEDDFNDYKTKIHNLKELLKENKNKKYEYIYEIFDSLNNKKLYLYFLFFQNYEKWINITHENNALDINLNDFIAINKKKDKKENIYSLLFYWSFYLYNEMIKHFYSQLNPNYSEINKIRYLFKETNILIIKFFKANTISTAQIFNLLNFSLYLIETNFEVKSYSDKTNGSKNYFLFLGLFFLLEEVTITILNKVNNNEFCDEKEAKENIGYIFSFLDDFKNCKEINSHCNIMVLINKYIILNFMNKLLDNIDVKIISKYEPKFEKKLVIFFSNYFKHNYKKSNIFNSLLSSLKKSFINLYNFENNKDKIIHDLFMNKFYTKLLKIIFYKDDNTINDLKRPLFDSFYFNGFDSQISLNIQKTNLEKSSLFFSFYLSPVEGRNHYPLFLIQRDFDGKKKDLLSLYLIKDEEKKDENKEEEYYLYLSQEGKEKQIENIPNIKSRTTYYISLCFNVKTLIIKFCNTKDIIISTEIQKSNKVLDTQSLSLSFGFYKKKVNVFSGYFGSIIMIKNPKNARDLDAFLTSVLKLESNYNNMILFMDHSFYSSENEIYYQKNLNNQIDCKLDKNDFLLYLIPETFRYLNDKSGVTNHFPNIDSICKIQRGYNIYNLNITLVKHEKGIINFIMDNGFNYIYLLYEYIYQFTENFFNEEIEVNNSYQSDKDLFFKMIASIFNKTLYILQKCLDEILIQKFSKTLKQIYFNLIYSLTKICSKYFIMEHVIKNCFGIIKYYYNTILPYIENKEIIPLINDSIFMDNLTCLNVWIDFLLTPNIYNYEKKDGLITLFKELSSYFNYIRMNKDSSTINKNLYNKLLDFIPFINDCYKNNINNDGDKNVIKEKKNIINEEDIFYYYFESLKTFFKNNLSKSENMINLKNIFIVINDYLGQENYVFVKFHNFINGIIDNSPEKYFIEDKGCEQIKLFMKYTNKFFELNVKKQESKNEKEINSKKDLLNKLLSILTRIIFSKKRFGKKDGIITHFIRLVEKVEKTKDLIITISNDIVYLFYKILSDSSTHNNNNIIYTYEDLNNFSNFYNDIFKFILYFLEDEINGKNNNNLNNSENVMFSSIKNIATQLKSKNDNGSFWNKTEKEWLVINPNKKNHYIEIIYIIINFLKFYYKILFTKVVGEKFILHFLEIFDLCCKSSLIYSNILIETEEYSGITKTPLEMILDICFYYIKLCLTELCNNSLNNKDIIINEYILITAKLEELLSKSYINSKKTKRNFTIFYINDYFRLLSDNYPIDGKKRPKNDEIFNNFKKEFNIYQNLEKVLSHEKKFNYNFTTFFILKCNGYGKTLLDLLLKMSEKNLQEDNLKISDLYTLILGIIKNIYEEQELLYSKNKNFYFKKANTSFAYYNDIKKQIENNIKSKVKDYTDIDSYIGNEIFNQDNDFLYYKIYSGLCQKEENCGSEPGHWSHHSSPKNINLHNSNSKKYEKKNSLDSSKKDSHESFSNSNDSQEVSSPKEKEKEKAISVNQEEFELQMEEFPFSASTKRNITVDNLNDDSGSNKCNISISTNSSKDLKLRAPSYFSLSYELSSKKTIDASRNFTLSGDISIMEYNRSTDDNTFINCFNGPDECFIFNVKKELMMTVFSLYFFDSFFNNETFKILKNYYFKVFKGIQKSTKLLDYPTKVKNFKNSLEPMLFLKPFSSFYINKTFPITHKYFYEYMKKNNIIQYEPIILYRKNLPDFTIEGQFDQKCELIKINQSYYGHIIGSKKVNYIIFEQQQYDFHNKLSELKKENKSVDANSLEEDYLNDMFSLTFINKKPVKHKASNSKFVKDQKSFEKRKKYKTEKKIIILFNDIEEIIERRFLLMWQAIEIYLNNGKSYFFNLLSEEDLNFMINIFKNNKITKDKVHTKDFYKGCQKKIFKFWKEERLSTYEYLLFLNKYGSRTFNDVNQYPIFPWIVRKYESDKNNKIIKKFRDFSFPMAAQNKEKRESSLERYQDDLNNGTKFPFHHGTHYSTSSYIYFYLMREEPFSTLLVKLQGYKQENPNRMFYGLLELLNTIDIGNDNRECIPDLFCKIEHFLNLNCVDFGEKTHNVKVDDFNICLFDNQLSLKNNTFEICDYVNFIFDNKKLFDEVEISKKINEWIDNIFGVGQLPEKNIRKDCYNIFRKETYQQKTNLRDKLNKMKKKSEKLDCIIQKIENKMNLIISFGQTPYQLFNEKHSRRIKKSKSDNKDEENADLEAEFVNLIFGKNIYTNIDELPIFFEINKSIGKVFSMNSKRKVEIFDTDYYNINEKTAKEYHITKCDDLDLSHIKFFEKIKTPNNYFYYIIKPKYSFCSFNIKPNISNDNENISYYNSYINSSDKLKPKKDKISTDDYITFITCRYMDNSFKIHIILNNKTKNELSFICEDFVSTCCSLDYNKFCIGLKNGKLIQFCFYKKNNEYKINMDKQIQAHKKAINVIEINKRLGIIITAGEDNYLFIRKLYDFELLTPIKIKSKYIITMAKVSPMNFLYIMCFNKKKSKKKSIILGYTLNGLYFAKSKYNYYDTLDFTRLGNIVTLVNRKEIEILSGDRLKNILINVDNKYTEIKEIQNEINGASWITFNYFTRNNENESSIIKVITYSTIDKNKGENCIKSYDVTKIKFFE